MAECRELWAWYLGLWVCPWPSRGILELRSLRGLWVDLLLKSWGRQQEMCSFSSLCVSSSLFYDLSQSWRSLLRKSTVFCPAAACVAWQTYTHHSLHLLLEKSLLPGAAAVTIPLGFVAFSKVQSTHFRMYRWMDLMCVLMCCAERHFCSLTGLQRVLS